MDTTTTPARPLSEHDLALPPELVQAAEAALQALADAGADAAQVQASHSAETRLQVAHNQPSLMRSTESGTLALAGIWGGRRAATRLPLASLSGGGALATAVQALRAQAQAAPEDPAQTVSSGQVHAHARGPAELDADALAEAAAQLLDWRATHTPSVVLEEATASFEHAHALLLTSGGSRLASRLGHHGLMVMGSAREGSAASSFQAVGGACDSLRDGVPAAQRFGIDAMLRSLARSVHTRQLAEVFGGPLAGEVVLAPQAVRALLGWLLGQLGDGALLGGTSVYRERTGQAIAAPGFTLRSAFGGPGAAPHSEDGCRAAPLTVVDGGRLTTLLPTLYGSRRLGLPAVPVASGWAIEPGAQPVAALIGGIPRGALVGRLSMGRPAANGDFSGVIKNGFAIDGGALGPALSETMVAGNVARMLRDIVAASAEVLDDGQDRLPWLRVAGLRLS